MHGVINISFWLKESLEMNKLSTLVITLITLLTLVGCEKDSDLLIDYVCPACDQQPKTYELKIGNQVTYQKEGSSQLLKTDSDGAIYLKGLDTSAIKVDGGFEPLLRYIPIYLTGQITVVEKGETEEIQRNITINEVATTDGKGMFYFTISYTTMPGKIISEIKNLNLRVSANVGNSNMVHKVNFDGTSVWSKVLGYLGAYSTYDISTGNYDCTADLCTWVDLGGDEFLMVKE